MKTLLFLCVGACYLHLGVLQSLYLTIKAPRDLQQQYSHNYVFISLEFNIASLNSIAEELDRPGSSFQSTDGVTVFLNDDRSAGNKNMKVTAVDFNNPTEAKTKLNSYVTEKTSGKIKNFFNDFKTSTDSVIVSYADAWKVPVSGGSKYTVQLTGEYNAMVNTELGFTMIEIPKNQNIKALIIIPDNGRDEKVGKSVTDKNLTQWRKSLTRQKINLEVPRATLFGCAAIISEEIVMDGMVFKTTKTTARISASFP
ncbi:thyroxine-binding globulin-like [Ranitomeya imitator]|uniref:thyroxine-binding globulin-like n=1 Tax=Ranitomeya imitator TaxID=111125 RepID=UPI001AA9809F